MEVVSMFLFISAIDKYVIKVNNNKLAYNQLEQLIHEPNEHTSCISQAKRHN